MDTSIRTSFIPKAPMANRPGARKEGMGFLTFLASAVLLVSLIGWGAAFAYKSLIEKDINDLEGYLAKANESFDPSLLRVFENLDRRIRGAEAILDRHTVITPFFELLDSVTLKSVRFNYFSLVNEGSAVAVKMSGQALEFSSIALQALEFNKDSRIINPIFSNLGVEDDQGRVSFDVSFNIDPEMILYKEKVSSLPAQ
jgi:hypothetical protein